MVELSLHYNGKRATNNFTNFGIKR